MLASDVLEERLPIGEGGPPLKCRVLEVRTHDGAETQQLLLLRTLGRLVIDSTDLASETPQEIALPRAAASEDEDQVGARTLPESNEFGPLQIAMQDRSRSAQWEPPLRCVMLPKLEVPDLEHRGHSRKSTLSWLASNGHLPPGRYEAFR